MRKDGGTNGRARNVPVFRACGLACTLGLVACGGDDVVVGGPGQPTGCPEVRIVGDTAEVTQFRDGPGRDLTDVEARGVIADFSGECTYGDEDVTVDLNLVIGAEKGPAAATDSARFDYFVAVTDPQQTILNKELFETELTFEGGAVRTAVVEELQLSIPLDQIGDGSFYEVLVGFQMTPDQLEFNRR
ncbi:MAG TPA: hypothetical protein VFO41_03320 [Alphaproteobacteria bacterium]|nr:hypothetical protein [Alphaproteobacteria bacterium]